jgi:hypothetical protein
MRIKNNATGISCGRFWKAGSEPEFNPYPDELVFAAALAYGNFKRLTASRCNSIDTPR